MSRTARLAAGGRIHPDVRATCGGPNDGPANRSNYGAVCKTCSVAGDRNAADRVSGCDRGRRLGGLPAVTWRPGLDDWHLAGAPITAVGIHGVMAYIRSRRVHRTMLLGERRFRGALAEFVDHYHQERNHRGLKNELIAGQPATSWCANVWSAADCQTALP